MVKKISLCEGEARIHVGHVVEGLAAIKEKSVQTCITSPPYWGMRNYGTDPQEWEDGWVGELGSEPSSDQFIGHLVEVFSGVERVLRDDGTLWVNLGDGWNSTATLDQNVGCTIQKTKRQKERQIGRSKKIDSRFPIGNQDLVPHRFALKMIESGWTLRSTIVWAKATSCKGAGGSIMPESANGWRWERCSKKVKGSDKRKKCKGCHKCEGNDGWVLRKQAWRPSGSFEYLFLFTKGMGYFCDMDAVKEKNKTPLKTNGQSSALESHNLRSVWHIQIEPLKDKHYAAYPTKLVRIPLLVSTSKKGQCPECGSPYVRMVKRDRIKRKRPNSHVKRLPGMEGIGNVMDNTAAGVRNKTLGWKASCDCDAGEPIPQMVLDPFMGTGTTLAVALKHRRHGIGCELKDDYVGFAKKRIRRLWRKQGLGIV